MMKLLHTRPRLNRLPPLGRLSHPAFTEAGAEGQSISRRLEDLLPAHLLDGGEIVILAIKPSLWFVVFSSARWVATMVMVTLLSKWIGQSFPQVSPVMVVKLALVLAGARVGVSLLQWVSRLYVLTNRRVLRLTGILNIDLFECSLTRIQNTYQTFAWYERLTGLGSISFATAGSGGIEASWIHINNPLEVHERVRAAIHRAQQHSNGSGL